MNIDVIQGIIQSLQPKIELIRRGNIETDGLYLCLLKAALAKNYEFMAAVFGKDTRVNPFTLNPSLRGLCEDIIALKFLSNFDPEDQDRVVLLLTNKQTYELVGCQQDFFSTYRPEQRVIGANDLRPDKTMKSEAKAIHSKLAHFKKKYAWNGANWPSVREMARQVALLPLYDYLYSATSSFVHFSPRNLARMGWGDIERKVFDYSTENFSAYYEAFNRFYSLFLFVTFCTNFAVRLKCRSQVEEEVEQFMSILRDEERWPELVTFEEMNWFDQGPIEIILSPFTVIGGIETEGPSFWQWV